MSFFKKIGRSIKKGIKGLGKGLKKVAKGVGNVAKKIVKSPIGRIALLAAGTYFGVPMLAGAFGGASAGAAAGSGVLGTIGGAIKGIGSGAMAGLSQAWSGLTGAIGAGSLSGAANSLSAGFSPSAALSAGKGVLGGATGAGAAMNPALIESAVGTAGYGTSSATPGFTYGSGVLSDVGGSVVRNAAGQVLQGQPQQQDDSFWNSKVGLAAFQGLSGAASAYGSAKMQEAAQERELAARREEEEREIARRNRNMGILNFGPTRDPSYYQRSSYADRFAV